MYKQRKVLGLSRMRALAMSDDRFICQCCKGTGKIDEGFGLEECTACAGTGYE